MRARVGARAQADAGTRGVRSWLADAPPGDRLFVHTMRRWLDGPCGQAEVLSGLVSSVGAAPAVRFLEAFEDLLRAVAAAARRRLARHATGCPCFGEDEALLAGLVRAAGQGDSATAWALAAGIARECDLARVVEAAAGLGRLMDGICGVPDPHPVARPVTRAVMRPAPASVH